MNLSFKENDLKKFLSFLLLSVSIGTSALAADAPKDPARQTSWGLYLDAKETYDLKTGPDGKNVLLVDVRDPVEIMFTGFTDVVDINIPFMLVNRFEWNDKRSIFNMTQNPDFESGIAKALKDRNLTKDSPVILMCRSGGERGAPSAKALEGKGYTKVYVVVDGFEGGTLKEGERKNWRLLNGWKNSGLPWSYRLNGEKIYRP